MSWQIIADDTEGEKFIKILSKILKLQYGLAGIDIQDIKLNECQRYINF